MALRGSGVHPVVVASIVTVVLVVALVSAVQATNWGSGAWAGAAVRCLDVDDADPSLSECGPDDDWHYVYVDGDVPASFETAVEASVTQDYDTNPNIQAFVQASLNDNTDVRVRVADIPSGTAWAYTCSGTASYGGGSGYYKWCKRQLLRVDPTRQGAASCLADTVECVKWLACHELGHTLGLQHTGDYPAESSSRDTCMDYQEADTNPDGHDREHLEDCIPHPAPAPATLTPHCENDGS